MTGRRVAGIALLVVAALVLLSLFYPDPVASASCQLIGRAQVGPWCVDPTPAAVVAAIAGAFGVRLLIRR